MGTNNKSAISGLTCIHYAMCHRAAHRAMARQGAAAEERAARLAEENAMLQRELSLRPTPDQYGSLQRQIDIMTRQLNALAAEKAASATAKTRCGS